MRHSAISRYHWFSGRMSAEFNVSAMSSEVFCTRPDWYQTQVWPAIRRRTVIAVGLLLLLCIWWVVSWSWIPLACIAVVVSERLFELLSLSSTKRIVASIKATATENGLIVESGAHASLYPWRSLQATFSQDGSGNVRSITINNPAKKRARLELVSLENMDSLATIIREQTKAE